MQTRGRDLPLIEGNMMSIVENWGKMPNKNASGFKGAVFHGWLPDSFCHALLENT